MVTSDSSRATAALLVAGMFAGPVAGGALVLLAKPFGGRLGIPGAVVGYVALTALLCACGAALLGPRLALAPRRAGLFALVSGAAILIAASVTHVGVFTAAVVIAALAAGPLLGCGRVSAVARGGRTLTGWHLAQWGGIGVAAGVAALSDTAPATALRVAGIACVLLGSVVLLPESVAAQAISIRRGSDGESTSPGWSRGLVAGYAGVGLAVGGTVLPGLHLLLFRWNALDAEQCVLLLLAVVPAIVVAALPAVEPDAIPLALIVAAGGALLIATAPGRVTLTLGLAVTLGAAACGARALDTAAGSVVSPARAVHTGLLSVLAALAGLGFVALIGASAGTGTGVTLLSLPVLLTALMCVRAPRPFAPARLAPEGNTP